VPEEPKIEIAAVRDPQLGAQVAIAEEFGYFKDEGIDAMVHWNQSGAGSIRLSQQS
jgi:ABC-type nitrate/sulfonate/bicarbonate transport system substrate-binding protein